MLAAALTLFGANALFGGRRSEAALRSFDRHWFDATAGRWKIGPERLMVDGFSVERRVPVFLLSYYERESLAHKREISCASRKSVVLIRRRAAGLTGRPVVSGSIERARPRCDDGLPALTSAPSMRQD